MSLDNNGLSRRSSAEAQLAASPTAHSTLVNMSLTQLDATACDSDHASQEATRKGKLKLFAGARSSGFMSPHVLEQRGDHTGQQEIDDVVRQGRNIGTVQPIHPGEGECGQVPAHNDPHNHAGPAVKQNQAQKSTHNPAQCQGHNSHEIASTPAGKDSIPVLRPTAA